VHRDLGGLTATEHRVFWGSSDGGEQSDARAFEPATVQRDVRRFLEPLLAKLTEWEMIGRGESIKDPNGTIIE
jgi:hypothetical protein